MSAPPGQRFIPSLIVYRILGQPRVDLDEYYLEVGGEVENPLRLTYTNLLSLPMAKVRWDFHCVTGWSVRDIEWEGIELSYIVKLARPKNGVRWLIADSLDGYSTAVYLEDALRGGLLALRMNGKELLPEHGFPVRLVFRDLYGWKGAKYVRRLAFSKEYRDGYWEKLGYHERGRAELEERFKL